jgi:large subunit ribosomal protein L33
MAKKGLRIKIHLKCKECGEQNYTTSRNKDLKKKLELKKYCPRCGKHTVHVEEKKLK